MLDKYAFLCYAVSMNNNQNPQDEKSTNRNERGFARRVALLAGGGALALAGIVGGVRGFANNAPTPDRAPAKPTATSTPEVTQTHPTATTHQAQPHKNKTFSPPPEGPVVVLTPPSDTGTYDVTPPQQTIESPSPTEGPTIINDGGMTPTP